MRRGDTFHGISADGRGVFTNEGGTDEYGIRTYAGQCKDGYACGLGVTTTSDGAKSYAEHGPDGQYDGRYLGRYADGCSRYLLWERGKEKAIAYVDADGTCQYNDEACAPNDPRLLALIAQVAPVEVRPAAPAPHPPSARHSDPSNRLMDRSALFAPRRRWRLPWPTRCIPTPHAVARRRATQPNHQSHCNARPRRDACTDRLAEVVTREALLHP